MVIEICCKGVYLHGKRRGYRKLDELVKVKKADESVLTTINDNELGYKKAKENLELLLKEIEK